MEAGTDASLMAKLAERFDAEMTTGRRIQRSINASMLSAPAVPASAGLGRSEGEGYYSSSLPRLLRTPWLNTLAHDFPGSFDSFPSPIPRCLEYRDSWNDDGIPRRPGRSISQ